MMQASMDMLLGSRSGADHELAGRAALALRLHSVPAISSKPLPSQRRYCIHQGSLYCPLCSLHHPAHAKDIYHLPTVVFSRTLCRVRAPNVRRVLMLCHQLVMHERRRWPPHLRSLYQDYCMQNDTSRSLRIRRSLAADEAGVFANPAYSPPSPAAEILELPQPARLVRKTSIAALRATIAARALPVLKSPLEAFQQRRSKSVNLSVPLQETEVSRHEGVCVASTRSMQLEAAGRMC